MKVMKRIVAILLALALCIGGAVYTCAAYETDPADALVHIDARPDFAFRAATTNSGAGEASPIESDYWLCAYPVTNEQYAAFVAATRHRTPSYWKNGAYPEGKADHPVLSVSYSDAAAYCAWLSAQSDDWVFRLPTEAEWENAALGTKYGAASVRYANSDSAPSYNAATCELTTTFQYNGVIAAKLFRDYGGDHVVNYIKGDYAGASETLGECISISASGGVTNWANHGGSATKGYFLQTDLYATISEEGGYTAPVDAYAPNTLGLYDMSGNSWDITSSVVTAQNGLEKGVDCYAVRGGSWYATGRSCQVSYRGEGRKDSPSSTVGFRLAADAKSALRGDVNGDGCVSVLDITALRRGLAGGYGVTLDPATADLNGDGTVGTLDVTLLRQYLAGGYGVTL